MALTASAKSSTPSTPPPAGNHVARCVRVIDLGLQKETRGQFIGKINHKLMLTWELPTETHVFDDSRGPEPFHVTSELTVSLSEKANLRKMLESWRGRPFTAEELEAFNVGKLLGVPCLLNVVHKKSGNGNTYGNVAGVTPLPKGFQCPPATAPTILYEVEMGRNDVFKALPEWIQTKIAACEDWKAQPAVNERPATTGDDYADASGQQSEEPF